MKIKIKIIALAVSTFFIFSCNEKDDFTIETADTYMPLAVGKYITYRVDSMVFVNFGKDTEIRSYQIKHRVDAIITDAEGRPAYRIYRSLRDVAGLQPWQEVGSYTVTTLSDQIEVTENNLRFIKLHSPVRFGFSWKGNKYFPDNPYNAAYNFSNDDNIEDWEYSYDELSSFSYGGINYTDVQTVEQIDEAFNVPITSPTSYAAKSRGVERYSKNIGLIYREYELWEYQPNTGNPAGPYKTGFGITMWMIDHN